MSLAARRLTGAVPDRGLEPAFSHQFANLLVKTVREARHLHQGFVAHISTRAG